jgi:hypothetical protein
MKEGLLFCAFVCAVFGVALGLMCLSVWFESVVSAAEIEAWLEANVGYVAMWCVIFAVALWRISESMEH